MFIISTWMYIWYDMRNSVSMGPPGKFFNGGKQEHLVNYLEVAEDCIDNLDW